MAAQNNMSYHKFAVIFCISIHLFIFAFACPLYAEDVFDSLTIDMSAGSSILETGYALESSNKKTAAKIWEQNKLQLYLIEDLIKGYGNAENKVKSTNQFGPMSDPYIGCDVKYDSKETRIARNEISSNLSLDFHEYQDTVGTREWIVYVHSFDDEEKNYSDILAPKDLTLSSEQVHEARILARTFLDPFPAKRLGDKYRNTPQGQSYEALDKIKRSNLLIPNAIMSDHIADHAPLSDSQELAQKIQTDSGRAGPVEGVEGGLISRNAILNYLVNSRFANAEWLEGADGINKMNETGLLREMAVMKSMELEQRIRFLKKIDQLAMLLSQLNLSDSQDKQQALSKTKSKALKESIN